MQPDEHAGEALIDGFAARYRLAPRPADPVVDVERFLVRPVHGLGRDIGWTFLHLLTGHVEVDDGSRPVDSIDGKW